MTIAVSRRAIAAVAVAAVLIVVAYLAGAARSGSTARLPGVTPVAETSTGLPTGITVSSTGTVTGTPDTLRLDIGVSVTDRTVSLALAGASAKAQALLKSLTGNGVAAKDVQTSQLSVNPVYSNKGGNTPTGYQVTESVTAKLRNLGKAGKVIGDAAAAGGNATRIDGVSLDLDDTSSLVAAARGKAFADAKAKAQQYAKAAGVNLGRVLSITDTAQTAPPVPIAMPTAFARDAAVPISPGSQEVGVTVTVVFAIG